MANANQNKPKTPEKKGILSKATPENIGATAVGLAIFSTLIPGLALSAIAMGGTAIAIKRHQRKKKEKEEEAKKKKKK